MKWRVSKSANLIAPVEMFLKFAVRCKTRHHVIIMSARNPGLLLALSNAYEELKNARIRNTTAANAKEGPIAQT